MLDRLAIGVSRYYMCFAPLKCKVLIQDWREPVPPLTICSDLLRVANGFKHLGSLVASGGDAEEKVSSRIVKSRALFANLRFLWCPHDIRLPLSKTVYNATVRSVRLYFCEICPIRAIDARRVSVFDHRYLGSIAHVCWKH